jgi:predicted DNA-binding transcriptional regulator AlpA
MAENEGSPKSDRRQVLPYSLPPRGLSRVYAAAYIGVSVSKFDEMVADGRMPKPIKIDGRRVWDRLKVDEYFAALGEGDGEKPRSIWDDFK